MSPTKSVQVLTLGTVNVTLSGKKKKFLAAKINLRISGGHHLRFRVGPKSNDQCPYKRQKERKHEEGKAMWRLRQRLERCIYKPRTPRVAICHQKQREAWKGFLEPSEGTNTANALISDMWTLEMWKTKFLLFEDIQFMLICFSSPRRLIHPTIQIQGFSVLCVGRLHWEPCENKPLGHSWSTGDRAQVGVRQTLLVTADLASPSKLLSLHVRPGRQPRNMR